MIKRFIIFALIISGCGQAKQFQDFNPYTSLADSTQINPGIDYQYFEYRVGPNSQKVLISKTNGIDSITQKIRNAMDSVIVDSGFSRFPHMRGFNYVLSYSNGKVSTWNTIPLLKEFLGEIDSENEALIYVIAHGFPPMPNDTSRTGVLINDNSYILRATKMDAICAPIITNRYTLSLSKSGQLDTLEITEISRNDKGCI